MRLTLWFLVDVVACHRLVRLVTKDVLTQPIRERLIRMTYRGHEAPDAKARGLVGPMYWQDTAEDDLWPPKIATLITCRWCSSVYAAAAVVAAEALIPGQWHYLAAVLAISTASTLLARAEADH